MNAETAAEVRDTELAARRIIEGYRDEVNELRIENQELRERLETMTTDRDRLHQQVTQLWEEGRMVASYVSTFFTRTASAVQGREFPEPAPIRPYSVMRHDAARR
jgi:uncharacterized coiled-coil DUF342 family protein